MTALVGESKEALRRRTSFAALGVALPMPRCARAVDASARSNGETGGGLGATGHASASASMARGVEGGGGTRALECTGATAEVRGVARAVEQPADNGAVVTADGDESAAARASSSARSAAASFVAAARAAMAAFSTACACASAASSASRHSAAANGDGATANGEGATANGDDAMDDFRLPTAPCLSS